MTRLISTIFLCLLILPVTASDADESDDKAKPEPTESPKTPSREELEKRFKESLTNVTLVGRWRLVSEDENGRKKLGAERSEKYTISSVSKVGKLWFITARIQYGDRDVSVPVPVRVEWAGDTPIISVTNAGIPGIGTYTARVMVYKGLYTGTWFGTGHGGLMSGKIVKNPAKGGGEAPSTSEKPGK